MCAALALLKQEINEVQAAQASAASNIEEMRQTQHEINA